MSSTLCGFLNPADDDRVATFGLNRTAAPHAARAALPHLENDRLEVGGTERNAGPHWDETRTGCAMG